MCRFITLHTCAHVLDSMCYLAHYAARGTQGCLLKLHMAVTWKCPVIKVKLVQNIVY